MNKRLFVVGMAALAVSLGAIMARGAAPDKKASPGKVAGKVRATVEKQAQAVKLPGPVTKTFKKAFPKGAVFKVDVEVENGVTVYDLEFRDGGIEKETDITADGTMLEFTVVVDAKAVPKAAMNAVRKAAQEATIKRIEHVEIAYETKDGKTIKLPKPITRYAVAVAKGQKTAEVVVAPDGTVVEPAKWAGAKEQEPEARREKKEVKGGKAVAKKGKAQAKEEDEDEDDDKAEAQRDKKEVKGGKAVAKKAKAQAKEEDEDEDDDKAEAKRDKKEVKGGKAVAKRGKAQANEADEDEDDDKARD